MRKLTCLFADQTFNCPVYKITDLYLGQKESFDYNVTDEAMDLFLKMTGDNNPLHTDNSFAKEYGFKNRVVYGMLTASLISKMGGIFLPGKYCLIQGVEVKMVKPVFIGDKLTVIGEVTKLEVALSYIEVKITIINQNNQKVLRGLLKAGVLNER